MSAESPRRPVRIAQIAAYQSNIGDNANLSGTRLLWREIFHPQTVEFTDIDIADFSWGLADYNEQLFCQIASHDCLIIGGGGFLELIPGTDSWTGTRINLPREFFDRLDMPVIFYALGIDTVRADLEGLDYSAEVEKLKTFIDYVSARANMLLSTRHDGAMNVLTKLLGADYAKRFSLIGDGGFFTTYQSSEHSEIKAGAINIAINLGGDLLDARFHQDKPGSVQRRFLAHSKRPSDYEYIRYTENERFNRFVVELANTCRRVIQSHEQVNLVFVPHIYRDIEMGFYLISELGFPYSRRHITMAPYLSGDAGKDYIVDCYRQCDLVIGMRFHANLCPIAVGTPSIGLLSFPMIGYLYQELGLGNRLVDPGDEDFEEKLFQLIEHSILEKKAIGASYQRIVKDLREVTDDFLRRVRHLVLSYWRDDRS